MYGVIYKISCTANGKIYIGKTIKTAEARLSEHKRCSRRNRTYTSYLYNAMNAYGEDKFVVETIEECDDESSLNNAETYWIRELHSQDPSVGYNIQSGGEGGAVRSKEFKLTDKQVNALEYGRHLPSSDAHKRQLSEYRRNVTVSMETRNKLRDAQTGKKLSDITKRKLSESHKGKIMPERSEESLKNYRRASLDRVHIHRGTENANPKRCDLQRFIDDGWELGYYYKK